MSTNEILVSASITITGLLICLAILFRMYSRAQVREQHLQNWLTHNLREIRKATGYAFPETVAICDALEKVFPGRSRVDVTALARALVALRVKHNADVLEGAGYAVVYTGDIYNVLQQVAVEAHSRGIHEIGALARGGMRLLNNAHPSSDRVTALLCATDKRG